MTHTVLLTGFGPFPGAPINPTGPLVQALAHRRHPAFVDVRRVGHIFRTSYRAVDKELPALIERAKPDALVMFGLASRSRRLRIETRACNARSLTIPDADGELPPTSAIEDSGPEWLMLPAPAQQFARAVRELGLPAASSRDAGDYLCNYLCWRVGAMAQHPGGPRIATFVHVPPVEPAGPQRARGRSFTLADLVRAGEAVVVAALAAARTAR
ncbi:MAG: pyroglutamyl-peptidase I [Xanthobacteraceae bacterium]